MSTNPILSAQEGAQPDERIEVPTINSAPVAPVISPGDESIIPAAASVLESQPDPSQAIIDPTQVDPMSGGDPNAPLQLNPIAPVLNPEVPLQPVLESTPGFNEALDSQNKIFGVQQNIQNKLATTVLPTDMQLPELFVGDPEFAKNQLRDISQRANDVIQRASQQPTAISVLNDAMKADAAKPKDKGFMQWLVGSGNTYNDFRPDKGQWGDYGSGALGATMYTLGLLGKAQATILGGATDSIVTAGNLIDAVKAKGFNPFSAEWRRDFDKEYQRNVFNSLPDPVLALQTAKKKNKNLYDWADYLGSRSYTLAPLLTPGRDLAFSNWQQDRSGRNNPLGFLYGKQSEKEGKTDWAKGIGALALDIIVDPTNLLRKPLKKAAKIAVRDVAQEAAEQAAKREAGRAVMIGLTPVAARARELPLPGGGVLRKASEGAAFVRPVEVVKKYRAYQQRLALPPAKETGGDVIDASYTVVKGEIPNMPRTVRQVAEQAADNPSVLEDLAKRFQEVDGREFPRGALNVELDQYAAEVAKAKTDKGRTAARNRLMARVDRLEKKWETANPRQVDFVSRPDMSRYDMSIYDDALLTGSNETPLKALPASGESGRVQYTFDPKSSPTLVVDRKGRFVTATPETIREVYKDNFEAVKLWKRAALPSESMRTQRMGVLQTEGRVVLNDAIDEGIREFRRTETQPVLPPAREGYTEYTLLPRTYVHDPETQKAISTFIDASGTKKRTQQRAYLESDYESIGERRLAATAVDLGDAQVVLPTVKFSLEDARKVFDSTTDVQPVKQGLESLLKGTRETFDGVTILNRGELEEFTQRMNGNAPELLPPVLQNPTAVPARLFAPQSDIMRLVVKPDVVDVHALENLSVRGIADLNKLVEYLPAPDGKRLLDRSYDTFDGLTSAIQRRLTGYPQAVIEHYLSTVSRLGQKVQGLEGDIVEVLLNRGTGDSLPSASVLMAKPIDDLPRLPYAEPNGIPSLAAINEALDNGLDPNRMLDNLTEPSLSDPIVRRNILENTPEEYRGIRPETQDMTIKRVELERELDDIVNIRTEVERTKDAVSEKLQDVLDEVETLPDIGLKPLPGTAMKDVPQLLPSTLSPTGVPLAELRQPLPELKNALPRLSMDDLLDEDGFRLPPTAKLSDLAQDKFDELFDFIDEIDPTDSFKMADLKDMSIADLDKKLKDLSTELQDFAPEMDKIKKFLASEGRPLNGQTTVDSFIKSRGMEPAKQQISTFNKVKDESFEVNPILNLATNEDIDFSSLSRVWGGMTETKRGSIALRELTRLGYKGDLRNSMRVADMMTNLAYKDRWTGGYEELFKKYYDEAVKRVAKGERADGDNVLIAKELSPSNKMYDYYKAEADKAGNVVLYEKSKDIPSLSGEEVALYELTRPQPPSPYYHGSRVQFLKLENVDPLEGAARGEFGTALYITKNARQAEAHAMADLSPNLPVINNRVFGDGAVHELYVVDRQGVISADDVASTEFKTLVKEALASVVDTLDPTHRKIIAAMRSPLSSKSKLTVGDLYDKMHTVMDKVMKQDPSYAGIDEALVLEWQRAFNLRLRQSGVRGIEKGDTLAVIDSTLLSTRYVKPYGNELESPLSVAASRYNAVTMALANNPKSTLLQVQQKEALATLLTRLDDRLQTQLDELDEQVIRQLSRMTEHDETLRSIVDGERTQRKALIAERLAEADAKTLEPKPFNTNPCL